jgi:eukaryotic-like serine/threonine-protein kinase
MLRDFLQGLNFKLLAKWTGISLAALLLIGLLFDKAIMPWYVRSDATQMVPNVVGMNFDEAREFLDQSGLSPHKSDERFDQRYPKGTVILQNPPPESIVKSGRRVYLILSSGEQLVEVPSLRGQSLRGARFTLERNGLTMGSIQYELSSDPENTIIDQSISAGTQVPRGTDVAVRVSQGSDTDRIMVPELVGKSLSEAQRLLHQRGLRIGTIAFQPIPDLLPNTIVQQYPHPGDRIPRSQPVDLFIAQEPPKETEEIKEGGGGYEH